MYRFKLDSVSMSFSNWFEILSVKSTTSKTLAMQGFYFLSPQESRTFLKSTHAFLNASEALKISKMKFR